jgi:hypothetical protein
VVYSVLAAILCFWAVSVMAAIFAMLYNANVAIVHPIRVTRRLMRRLSVVSLLSGTGVLVSMAALGVIIGIGEVQIGVDQHHSGDLFANAWFDIGLFLGGLALLSGIIAISASAEQSIARSAFPDIRLEIIRSLHLLTFQERDILPGGPKTNMGLVRYRVRFINNELTRRASVSVTLQWKTKPDASPPGTYVDFMAIDVADGEAGELRLPGLVPPRPLRQSIDLGPRDHLEGDLYFQTWFPETIDTITQEQFVIVEYLSHSAVSLPVVDGIYDLATLGC